MSVYLPTGVSFKDFMDFTLKQLQEKDTVCTSGFPTCLDYALHQLPEEPFCLEFGVFQGHTLHKMAKARPMATVIGFDSFEGLPEHWRDNFGKGMFNLGSQIPRLPENSAVFKGWFNETVPRFKSLLKENKKVDLIHMDADLYSSTKTVFDCLHENIKDGTYIVFDELLNYPGYQDHEMKALYEFCQEHPEKRVEVIGTFERHEQAVVRVF